MKIAVITNEELKAELLAQGLADELEVVWLTEINSVPDAIAYIDLLFTYSAERIYKLKTLQPATIIVNAVIDSLAGMPAGFTRLNGWNSFLKRPVVEAAGADKDKVLTAKVFSGFNKKMEWVPDIPGFITARVISMIINEAYFGLEEKISSKEEIDTAMKLGTNYPYGPFEWGAKIGLKHIDLLLSKLEKEHPRYKPSVLLQKEARSV